MEGSRRSLVPALAFIICAAAAGTLTASAALADGDGPALTREAAWDVVGVTSARSSFVSDTRVLRVALAPGDRASFTRRLAADAGSAIRCTFNVNLTGMRPDAAITQVFRVGSEFAASNSDDPEARSFARLSLHASVAGFRLGDAASDRLYHGTQAVTWALNHSGSAVNYAAPDGTTHVLANDRMDVWVGSDQVVKGEAALTPGRTMSDLKWYWVAGSGTTTVDHFAVAPLADAAVATAPNPGAAVEATAATVDGAPLELYRPTPNPFENTTHFVYLVSHAGEPVNIGVFDVSGRRVRGLVQGLQAAGRYEVAWDGRADDGARSRHGIYFLRASMGPTTRIARVVYLFE